MILEKNKKPGVCYAMTDDGIELPVIDITNPFFTESINPERSAALARDFLEFQKSPALFRRFFGQRSIAMRGINSGSSRFLGGMTTYIAKLGPDVLGRGYSGWVDRKVAGGIGSVAFRLRLQDTAQLLAEELEPQLAARKGCGLDLLNIGGGPAMDSLNALILIWKENPARLKDRRISIHILDLDRSGPSFGSRAAAALSSAGAPLHGVGLTMDPIPYDWTQASDLGRIVKGMDAKAALIGSSEGGLLEYGSNEVIVDNLRAIRDVVPDGFVIVGSIFRNGTIPRWLQATSKMSIRTFELEELGTLVESAGWEIRRVKESSPVYQVVCLSVAGKSAAPRRRNHRRA